LADVVKNDINQAAKFIMQQAQSIESKRKEPGQHKAGDSRVRDSSERIGLDFLQKREQSPNFTLIS
jgi:hypothetical protein